MITQNSDTQNQMTPEGALALLAAGNKRFLAGEREERALLTQVEATRGGQWPFAAVVACIDSRVAPELVFDQGIGDLFIARVAGNFVNADILGSLEFACKVAGSKLVLVLGHTHCGAIKGACDHVRMGNLTELLSKLEPAVDETEYEGERGSGNPEFVRAVAERNVDRTLDAIRAQSDVLRELEDSGAIRIVGAMYDVESGAVELRGAAS